MAEGEGGGGFIMQKVGPLPLVVWVMGGAGVVFVILLMKGKSSSGGQANATNQISALAPTEAEAFGTIEQQQQDVTNALTTLGQNQSALGGSISTLAGMTTQQGLYNSSQFANLLTGQGTIEQGQAANASAAYNYWDSLQQYINNYGTAIQGQLNGVNSNLQTHVDQAAAAQQGQGSGLASLLYQIEQLQAWYAQHPGQGAYAVPGVIPTVAAGSAPAGS